MKMIKNKDIKNVGDYYLYDCNEDYNEIWALEDYQNEIDLVVKDYDYYLTFAFNCNWRGSNGYKIYDNKLDAFAREYDFTQKLISVSHANKACLLKEYHHDVPTGHDVVIVGLNYDEYLKLENANFEKVEQFAESYREKLKA